MWHATVKAGGGLTIGSDPAAEVREAKLKVWIDRFLFGSPDSPEISQLPERRPGFCMWPLGKARVFCCDKLLKCGGFLWR